MAKKKSNIGRPTVMTNEVICKLEQGFAYGFTDLEACLYANISQASLYEYCKLNPSFSERKEMLKRQPLMQAKLNVHEHLLDKDVFTSRWILEKKDKDFNPKHQVDISSEDGSLAPTVIKIVAGNIQPINEDDDEE